MFSLAAAVPKHASMCRFDPFSAQASLGDQDGLQQEVAQVRARMLELMSRRLACTRARSKVADQVDGETVGLHHVAAALRLRIQGAIGQLKDRQGNVLTEPAAIADLVRAHYADMFAAPAPERQATQRARGGVPTQPAPDSQTPLLDGAVPASVLDSADSEAVLRHFTLEELGASLKASPRGKSPGEDGLSAEFYCAVAHTGQNSVMVS